MFSQQTSLLSSHTLPPSPFGLIVLFSLTASFDLSLVFLLKLLLGIQRKLGYLSVAEGLSLRASVGSPDLI